MDGIDLKPCPFCGGTKLKVYTYYYDDGDCEVSIACKSCGAKVTDQMSYSSKEEAKAATAEIWNRRCETEP